MEFAEFGAELADTVPPFRVIIQLVFGQFSKSMLHQLRLQVEQAANFGHNTNSRVLSRQDGLLVVGRTSVAQGTVTSKGDAAEGCVRDLITLHPCKAWNSPVPDTSLNVL